jgi:hypothetical protein
MSTFFQLSMLPGHGLADFDNLPYVYDIIFANFKFHFFQLSMLPGRGSADFDDLTESTGMCTMQRHGGQVWKLLNVFN